MLVIGHVAALLVSTTVPSVAKVTTVDTMARTTRFEIRSDTRVNLHHFLLDWASAEAGRWPEYAPPITERENWRGALNPEEQRSWSAAVAAYATAVGRSLLFDAGLLAVRDWAAGARERERIPAGDRALAAALEAVLPIYRRHWWSSHDAANRSWIAAVTPTLALVESEMATRLEAAYGGRWPRELVSIDIVAYANDVGAYSTGGRITIASGTPGLGMPQSVELVFHEASHTDGLEGPLRRNLAMAFRSAGGAEPDRFWHDMIFYTAGEVTRIVLARHGQPGYQHYGSLGVYRRGERWPAQLQALAKDWTPFLESGSAGAEARRAALEALARSMTRGLAATPAPVRLTVVAQADSFTNAARAYQEIWDADGARIIAAMERISGLRFASREYADTVIVARVTEAVSMSGYRDTPMTLRASYPTDTKKATLIHELGHRLQSNLFRQNEQSHPYLFLWLYDTWVALYGQPFADEQVAVERARRGPYPAAWDFALGMSAAERASRWRAIVAERQR